MKYQLIIFDMDGTLVQSEDCASQAICDVVPGLSDSVAQITEQYRGMRLADIFTAIAKQLPGIDVENCIELYREREEILSRTMITPSLGVEQMLSKITHKKCIASNAPVEKTKRSLELCALSHHFEDAIFSAYDVQAWKPDPDLFLHAAKAYGVDAENCLVVEDSKLGIRAAQSAGMVPIYYNPHKLSEAPPETAMITELTELIDIVS